MNAQAKTIQEINARCREGAALVFTETEIWERIRSGTVPEDMDVVVFSFSASMRGSAAMILTPVTGKGVFTRAEDIFLDGVRAYPGPAPNERLGVVDAQLFADQTVPGLAQGPIAPGARVLLDVLAGREIEVECRSVEGGTYHNRFKRDDLEFARMVSYNTFLPPWLNTVPDAPPPAHLGMIRAGGVMFLNRSPGVVVGDGTRSAPGRAALSLSADMLQMDRDSIETGDDVLMSVAVPVPVVNDAVRAGIVESLGRTAKQDLERFRRPTDRAAGAYVKDALLTGKCALTDSFLTVTGFDGTGRRF